MSDRARDLADRRATLLLRCAVQRRAIDAEVRYVEQRLATVDRVVGAARTVASHPAVIVAGVAAAIVLARTRGVRVIGNALMLIAGVRKLFRLLGPAFRGSSSPGSP
ncbi:MAG TPA: hypothetical protein VFX89_21490 [Gammaproteobacteria bacterium]|nr:hypothetical protein [Gammaproteobacteria bacterium]